MPRACAAINGCKANGTLNRLLRYTTSGPGDPSVPLSLSSHHFLEVDDL